MATQKTKNNPKQDKNFKQASREVARRAQPHIPLSALNDLMSVLQYFNQLMKYWDLHYATFNILMAVVREYHVQGKGITMTAIMRVMGKKGNNYRVMNNVINTLTSRGLVEVIGTGYMNCNVYAPTAASLKVLNAVVEVMSAA